MLSLPLTIITQFVFMHSAAAKANISYFSRDHKVVILCFSLRFPQGIVIILLPRTTSAVLNYFLGCVLRFAQGMINTSPFHKGHPVG